MSKITANAKIKYPNRWRKGTSGNSNGRPKIDPNIRELAKTHTAAAIAKLFEVTTGSEYSPELQGHAACILLSKAWGWRQYHPKKKKHTTYLDYI
jgi:hypothetical protein